MGSPRARLGLGVRDRGEDRWINCYIRLPVCSAHKLNFNTDT